jgi:ATP-dependent 26S proteasome regulatory subunit
MFCKGLRVYIDLNLF